VVLLDVVVVLSLTALALLGLATTFVSWRYLVVGMVAAAVGALLVLLTQRAPLGVLVATTPLVALVLGGPVALQEQGLGAGVPDLQTLADVLQGSATGWLELLTTLPFVDVAGPPALVPYLLGFLGATTALALAVRTRSSGVPVLPLLGVLVAVLLLRRPEGGTLDWYPVAFAGLAIVWVVIRGLQLAPDAGPAPGRRQGRFARGVAAAAVVAIGLLVAVPLTSSSAPSSGASLRGTVRDVPDVETLDSPLRRFRTFTEQEPGSTGNVYRRRLFTVTGAPAGSRVRMLALDTYDGHEWRPGNDTVKDATDDAFLRMDTLVDNPARGAAVRVRVDVAKAYRSAWLPTVGSLTSLRFLTVESTTRRSQLRYNLATSTAVVPVGISRTNDYELAAILEDQRLLPTMEPWLGPGPDVDGAEKVDPLIRDVLDTPGSAMAKLFAVAHYLRSEGRYSNGGPGETRYRAGHDLDRLTKGFLLARRPVGDDEQYAAAMALVAHRLGLVSRVAVGAVVPRDGVVRGADVHAWVEVRIADGSWRTLPTREFMSRRPPTRVMSAAPPPRIPPSLAQEQPQDQPQADRQQAERKRDGEARRNLVLRALPWLLLLLVLLVVPLAKLARRAVRRRRGRPSDRMAGAWLELVDHARDLGIPVRLQASRPAQARVLAQAAGLSREGDQGVFAEDEPTEAVVTAYWDQVMAERRRLGQMQRLRRRWWAPFNPTSLRGRPATLD
jgi:hypothetical protein